MTVFVADCVRLVSTAGTSPKGPFTGPFMGPNQVPALGQVLTLALKNHVGLEVYSAVYLLFLIETVAQLMQVVLPHIGDATIERAK